MAAGIPWVQLSLNSFMNVILICYRCYQIY